MNTRTRQVVLCVLALVLLGAAAITIGLRRAGETPDLAAGGDLAPAAGPSRDPVALAEVAHARLPATADARLTEHQGPVTTANLQTRGGDYLGDLTLWVACAGAGRITMTVVGVLHAEAMGTESEVARIPVDCADDPVPVQARFPGERYRQYLRFDLADTAGAVGAAGFAFRLTSNTGRPMTASDISREMSLDDESGHSLASVVGDGDLIHQGDAIAGSPTVIMPVKAGSYAPVGVCAGLGTLVLLVGEQRQELPCSWPPKRKQLTLAPVTGTGAPVTVEYLSTSSSAALYSIVFVPR
ncbi:hypothetical protein ACIA8K_22560 [Catenuloplanes sp. NPDC051500]|uniref:hypothetical protein n=1 Tax=Catenuloplanes sp. NPDC051500 TaxID=3363959 RepID=UPI0037A93492